MSYYRKFKDFIGKMQTNKLPVWHSSALPKNGLIILSFFEFECASRSTSISFTFTKTPVRRFAVAFIRLIAKEGVDDKTS